MPERSLAESVEILEQHVRDLQSLPDRVAGVELQILQLRGEMHGEFSAIREELRGHHERFATLDNAMAALRQDVADTRNQARVLHEEVLSRIAMLQEGRRRKR